MHATDAHVVSCAFFASALEVALHNARTVAKRLVARATTGDTIPHRLDRSRIPAARRQLKRASARGDAHRERGSLDADDLAAIHRELE